MNSLKKDNYFNLTNIFFITAILIFSITSLFHVSVFWLITNSLFLSIIMSVATGVGIISSLLSTKYTKLTYISFTLIILIELFGNIYGSFIHIDVNSEYFKGWKELMEPVFSMFYTVEEGQAIPDAIYKRWAAIIQGSFIPLLLSITFHMWMVVRDKYEKLKTINKESSKEEPLIDGVTLSEDKTSEEILQEITPEIKNTDKERKISDLPLFLSGFQEMFYPENKSYIGLDEEPIDLDILIFDEAESDSPEISEEIVNEEILETPIENKEVPKEIVKEVVKEPKTSKGRTINVKSDDIGTIYLKPENGNK